MVKFTNKLLYLFAFLLVGGFLSAQVPFYTEDFADGLPDDWTAIEVVGNGTSTANWFWTNTGPNGSFPIGAIQSTTAANGWMIFDSDLNCSGEQDAWLVSPELDLSDKTAVTLQFLTHYRRFNDKTYLEFSTDNVTWTEVEIFGAVTNNQYPSGTNPENPFLASLDISQYASGQSSFWFAFRFLADPSTIQAGTDVGCAYSWQIDDVALLDFDPTPATDLKLVDPFYATASYAQPKSQIGADTLLFYAKVDNVGSKAVPNVVLRAEVKDAGGAIIFQDSLEIASIETGDTTVEMELPNVFIPDQLEEGDYTINYTLYSRDSIDADPANNSASRGFAVTSNLYSKENGISTYYGGLTYPYYVGAVYKTGSNWVDNFKAVNSIFSAAKNSADGPLAGETVNIVLVEVNEDVTGPNWNSFNTSGDYANNPSLTLRSINEHTFTTSTTSGEESHELVDFETDEIGVDLKENNRYILLAEYDGSVPIFHGYNANLAQLYFPSTIVYTSDDDTWYLGGWQGRPAINLRMEIALISTADEKALPDNAFSFYPNPVSDKLNVRLSLEQPTVANVTIADLSGKVIKIDEIVNAYQDSREYNVSNLPSGTYIVRLATKEGTSTKKFVIQR